ncbi:MAG TPA: outer membrane protein [Xanthobacteraceae bacterium]|nr:outer membrane protein [Xanthobacteraceae bacterium]
MKKLLLAATALGFGLSASAAFAADMSYPVKAAPIMAPIPVFSWTGFYIGANVGYGWAETDNWNYGYYDSYNGGGKVKPDGWFGGGQIGYNYQFTNNVVVGLEADFEFADMKDTRGYNGFWDLNDWYDAGKVTTEIESFGTIRARLGYAYDRFLPYVTGGLAWGNVKVSDRWTEYDGVNDLVGETFGYSADDTLWGWTIGAGIEYAITDNWTTKIEYLYADLGSIDFNGHHWNDDLDVTLQTVKIGVNYKF